jgi:hypothetical protein
MVNNKKFFFCNPGLCLTINVPLRSYHQGKGQGHLLQAIIINSGKQWEFTVWHTLNNPLHRMPTPTLSTALSNTLAEKFSNFFYPENRKNPKRTPRFHCAPK